VKRLDYRASVYELSDAAVGACKNELAAAQLAWAQSPAGSISGVSAGAAQLEKDVRAEVIAVIV
jgi:hypothetical protein